MALHCTNVEAGPNSLPVIEKLMYLFRSIAPQTPILEAMTDALCRGESIEIRGFGSFAIKRYDAYEGRNPKTGKLIEVKPKKLPFFKVGKELRRKVDIQKGPNQKGPVGII